MLKKSNFVILLPILAILSSTLACGFFSTPPATEAMQSAPATEASISASTDTNATISCSQLIPADELNNLLFNPTATLKENSFPGGISCEWKYTPNGATQESLFYIQVDFSNGATSLWEATHKSDLSNEPSDIVVNSIDGLGAENYTWVSQSTGQRVVYARKGSKTLIMRFASDVLYLQNESGIIDYAERIFSNF